MWMNTQIIALDSAAAEYYTPWFPKGADNGIFTMELIQSTLTTVPIAVTVWTKNREDEGSAPGTSVGTFASLSGSLLEVACANLKELVRFRIYFRGQAGQGAIFRFLGPTWYDTAV